MFIIRGKEYLRNTGDVVNLQVQIAAEREDPVLLPNRFPTIKSYDWAHHKVCHFTLLEQLLSSSN